MGKISIYGGEEEIKIDMQDFAMKFMQQSFKNHIQSKKLYESIRVDYGVVDNEKELYKSDLLKNGLSEDCLINLCNWYEEMAAIF